MGWTKVHQIDLLTVEMETHFAAISNDRQSSVIESRLLNFLTNEINHIVLHQHATGSVMRDEAHPVRAQRLVAVGMVKVPMRIYSEINLVAAEVGNRATNFRYQLRHLIVDHKHAVSANGYQDISSNDAFTNTKQDMLTLAQGLRLYSRVREILRARCTCRAENYAKDAKLSKIH